MRFYSILIFLLLLQIGFAQNETNIWYFGRNAGLDFNTGSPVALLNGQVDTDEGCATISDNTGSLLFYTDGITVYNRNHQIMLNGTGLNGNITSTHSAIIIPKPNDPSVYFIFTVDATAGSNGLQYSEVDMQLDSGLGGISVNKNVPLFSPVTEKLTAIQSATSNEYWVVSHKWNSNEFISYKVTGTGVNVTPVISAIGTNVTGNVGGETIGQVKISPDGSKIAVARAAGLSELQLFDFDATTGQITNPQTLIATIPATENVYGVEFSPNSELLYTSILGDGVYQFDVSLPTTNSIINSRIEISPQADPYAALQLASDGRIYIAKGGRFNIDVINNPNLAGIASNYGYDSVFLNGRRSAAGLPPFIQSFLNIQDINVNDVCFGDSTQFSLNETFDSVSWDFDDSVSGSNNNSNLPSPSHVFSGPGDYDVTITATLGGLSSTLTTTVTIYEQATATMPQDILICDPNNDGFFDFDLTTKDSEILNGQSLTVFEVVYYNGMTDYNNAIPISNPNSFTNSLPYGLQTIVASVRNINNTECESFTSFDIQVFESPVPSAVIPAIEICDNNSVGNDADGLVLFDLNVNEAILLNGQSPIDFELEYFTDAGLTAIISNPNAYQNTNPTETIYVRMLNRNNTSCMASTSFIIEVLSLPVINNPVQLDQCDDDTDGISVFNLSEVIGEITLNTTTNTISFHYNLLDAQNDTNLITNITAYQNSTPSTEIIYARVENSDGCYRVAQVNLQVITTQIPPAFSRTFYKCDDGIDLYDGIATFDLSTAQADIAALFPSGQPIDINFYRNELDALAESNPISNISTYENIGYPSAQNIYVRVDNTSSNDCIGLGHHVTLVVEENPLSTGPVNIEQCDINNDGTESIDTSNIITQLLQGQTGVDLVFRDSTGSILPNPLPNPFITSTQSISVEMSNNSSQDPDGACTVLTSIDITIDAGVVANPIPAFDVCDDDNDGFFAFDTLTLQSTILGIQTGVTVTYEDQNGNLLPSPLPNPFVSDTQTITATVINPTNSFCFEQTNIDFIVNSVPVANTVMDDIICDDSTNDGQHLFDLTSYDNQLLNGQSLSTYSISYYNSQSDADSGINALPSSYLVMSVSETIYARIENSNNPSCYDTTSFEIGVSRLPIANTAADVELCDDSINDGVEIFDLSSQNMAILNGQSATDNVITFHSDQLAAEQGISPLPSNYSNTTSPETIYARIENRDNSNCYAVTFFDLIVYEQPVLLMKDEWTICENDLVEIVADSGYDNYLWSTGETTESIIVTLPGNYDVTVSNNYGTIICDETKSISVIESTVAVITNIEIEDWSQDNNSVYVEVQGTGDYEYSLDGVTYQESNRFDNLPMGDYQIYVRDHNGCGIIEQDIYLLFYPRYFTPNGDNYHDFWQLYNSEREPDNKIYIYDRYGKFLKQLNPIGIGWDGTYNGNPLPSSDYWFVVERANGKTYRGHFALKR